MKTDTTKPAANVGRRRRPAWEKLVDPLEAGVRTRIRGFIEALLEAELDIAGAQALLGGHYLPRRRRGPSSRNVLS